MGREIVLYKGPEIERGNNFPQVNHPLVTQRESHPFRQTSPQDFPSGLSFLDSVRKVREILGKTRPREDEEPKQPLVHVDSQRTEIPLKQTVSFKGRADGEEKLAKRSRPNEAIVPPKSEFSGNPPAAPLTLERGLSHEGVLKPILRPELGMSVPKHQGVEKSGTIFPLPQSLPKGEISSVPQSFEKKNDAFNHKPLISFETPLVSPSASSVFKPTGFSSSKSDIISKPAQNFSLMGRKEVSEPLNPCPVDLPSGQKGLSATPLKGELSVLQQNSDRMTRREFLRLGFAAGTAMAVGEILAACGMGFPEETSTVIPTPSPESSPTFIPPTETRTWEGYPPPVNPPEFIPEAVGGPFPEAIQEVAANDRYLALLTLARQEGETFLVATEEEYRRWLDNFAERHNLEVQQTWNGKSGDLHQLVSAIVKKNPDESRSVLWFATPGGALSARPDIPSEQDSALTPVPLPLGTHPGWRWGEDGNVYMYEVLNEGDAGIVWFNTTRADALAEGGLARAWRIHPDTPDSIEGPINSLRDRGVEVFPLEEERELGLYLLESGQRLEAGELERNGFIRFTTEKNEPARFPLHRLEGQDGRLLAAVNQFPRTFLEFEEGEWVSDRLLYLAAGPNPLRFESTGENNPALPDYPLDIEGRGLPTAISGAPHRAGGLETQGVVALLMDVGDFRPDPVFPGHAFRISMGFYDVRGYLHTYEAMIDDVLAGVVGTCVTEPERAPCWVNTLRGAWELITTWDQGSVRRQFYPELTVSDSSASSRPLTQEINRFADTHSALIEAVRTGDGFPEPPEGYFIRVHQFRTGL